MKDSSHDTSEDLKGVALKDAVFLLRLLGKMVLQEKPFIEARYNDRAQNFDRTLTFLKKIGSITEKDNSLSADGVFKELVARDESAVVEAIVEVLFGTKNRCQTTLLDFLSQFKVSSGDISYKPVTKERHRNSTVRNFLMELGIVTHSPQSDEYLLNPDRFDLFLMERGSAKAVSPSKLKVGLRGRESIGFAAENAIFRLEQQRVSSHLVNDIDHVALRNASAGYDIKSFTEESVEGHVPRYIEVKAVPPSSMRFYWTANERKMAQLLKEFYFLYLLPVLSNSAFDVDGLQIIQDPFLQVYQTRDEWLVEEDVVSCRLQKKCSNFQTTLRR